MIIKNFKPVIVVVAYNRVNSLRRLLGSLTRGQYPDNTKLIISIDHSPENSGVVECAREFEWSVGEKDIILHPENIGLRKHIISCGDLSYKYGSVIILEDDLFVSPFFYQYSLQALGFYKDKKDIAGIGLFNYPSIERSTNPEPFSPVLDGSDVFFIQYACSSGQAWSNMQWDAFRKWYAGSPDTSKIEDIPAHILGWPESSWKKYFNSYLIMQNRFFVYPRFALTSNFDDVGTNRGMTTKELQPALLIKSRNFLFNLLKDSISVYDAHFEIMPEKLKEMNKKLESYDFSVDLYGHKNAAKIKEEFLLTTKNCREYSAGFSRSLKPHEMNIVMDLHGEEIFLCRKKDLIPSGLIDRADKFISDFNYFYRTTLLNKEVLMIVWYRMYNKIKRLKNN